MKKYILFISVLFLLFLAACGNNDEDRSAESESVQVQAQTETEESAPAEELENESDDVDFKEIISDSIREGDKITKFSNKGNVIKTTIKLAEDDLLSKKDLAETIYSSIGESLFGVEDWQVLTINIVEVGEVSFNRDLPSS